MAEVVGKSLKKRGSQIIVFEDMILSSPSEDSSTHQEGKKPVKRKKKGKRKVKEHNVENADNSRLPRADLNSSHGITAAIRKQRTRAKDQKVVKTKKESPSIRNSPKTGREGGVMNRFFGNFGHKKEKNIALGGPESYSEGSSGNEEDRTRDKLSPSISRGGSIPKDVNNNNVNLRTDVITENEEVEDFSEHSALSGRRSVTGTSSHLP